MEIEIVALMVTLVAIVMAAVKRKLIFVGGNLVVAIPRPFLEGSRLQKGDTVDLVYDNSVVLIKPEEKEAAR